jgi:hypothetical protein
MRDRWADKQVVRLADLQVDPEAVTWRLKPLLAGFRRRRYTLEQRQALRTASDRRARADQARAAAADPATRPAATTPRGARPPQPNAGHDAHAASRRSGEPACSHRVGDDRGAAASSLEGRAARPRRRAALRPPAHRRVGGRSWNAVAPWRSTWCSALRSSWNGGRREPGGFQLLRALARPSALVAAPVRGRLRRLAVRRRASLGG